LRLELWMRVFKGLPHKFTPIFPILVKKIVVPGISKIKTLPAGQNIQRTFSWSKKSTPSSFVRWSSCARVAASGRSEHAAGYGYELWITPRLCPAALFVYDSLTERTAAAQETVEALESDVSTLRANSGGLDARARASKFSAANSALSLAQSDLGLAADALSLKKAEAVRTGKAAASKLFEARDLLRLQRVANVSAWLSAQFDFSQVSGVRAQDLANVHESVRAIANLGASNLFFELQHADDFTISALRRLNEHWAELKPLIEAEPGLELNIAPVQLSPPIVKPKPAQATMNAALVAA
jgi:hypothetical protein